MLFRKKKIKEMPQVTFTIKEVLEALTTAHGDRFLVAGFPRRCVVELTATPGSLTVTQKVDS